jgi:hypothetical protein
VNISPRMQKLMDKRGWTIEQRLYECANKNHLHTFIVAHSLQEAAQRHCDEPTHTSACVVRLVRQHR